VYIYIYIYICDRGQSKYSEKNLCQCHFVHQKSQMNWPTYKPGLQLIVTSDFCCAMARKTKVKWPANKPVTFGKKSPKNRIYPGSLLLARQSVLHHCSSNFVQQFSIYVI
jgi:hypothetical protein